MMPSMDAIPILFLSTLSLRRATNGYPHTRQRDAISIHALLAESDTWARGSRVTYVISIHALLAESDQKNQHQRKRKDISIHALLAESDATLLPTGNLFFLFLSTLSLRRATRAESDQRHSPDNFYPRSPCGERQNDS